MGENQLANLEALWYQKLFDSGFRDIEDIVDPDRPLTNWDSFRFVSVKSQQRKIARTQYQIKIDAFANDQSFHDIVKLMVRHGNNLFDEVGIEQVWDMHRLGHSERGIAFKMGCSRSCITFMLRRMREWMSLVV